ncbi:MAG: 23S rRNA (adenine(2503)-C(2))-methyltransferase RlmN [bacterium]|nr:23S rRNA (adenine(2503)-C(2))-methyltransferase RlmN [bacterium]
MNIENLEDILKNEPRYRLKQIKEAVFRDLIDDWSKASNLPLALREKLSKECPLEIKGEILKSGDGQTVKALIELDDLPAGKAGGLKIESVLMKHKDGEGTRNTVCVSSQVGCPMACKFCATGEMGFKRNLTVSEILEQVLFFARAGNKISNIVFMGMGEPFLNYENVMAAICVLNGEDSLNIGARKISISTSGVIEGIEKLAEEKLQLNLAISLHAPDDELRSELMPVNKKYPLEKVLEAVDGYIKKTSRRVMFEYLLIKGVNDSPNHARRLARIMRKPLYMVNLIKYNPAGGDFQPSDADTVERFKGILEKEGVAVTLRHRFGGEIKAACGQLAGGKNF